MARPSAESTRESNVSIDVDALRARYARERSRRMSAGRGGTVESLDEVPGTSQDPHTAPIVRPPVRDVTDVAIVGAGFGGLLVGAHLRKAGVTSIRLIDKAGDVGGTWYWNRYPGAQCDVESYIYLPLLEEIGYIPKEKYSRQPEIFAHGQAIARQFDLYEGALFQTQVTGMRWNADSSRWTIETDRGDEILARFVCMVNGPLNRPKLPAIDGISTFKGHRFHTSRWDYDYTGGTTEGGLSRLSDKSVGIIGSGATAVQCVPHLGRDAGELYVFQRTPSTIAVRGNRPTDSSWAEQLQPGWQKQRIENFCAIMAGEPNTEDFVQDGWTDAFKRLSADPRLATITDSNERLALVELADLKLGEDIRARIAEIVGDATVRETLRPYYWYFCKRPCFHDEFLSTFNRPNVHLVDAAEGIDRITEDGVVVDGRQYKVDCLIFATGFEVGTPYARRAGYEVLGVDGLTLSEKWADGVSTLHGMTTRGFPNLIFSPGQEGQFAWFAVNVTHALTEFANHAAHIISESLRDNVTSFEPTELAEDEWVQTIIARSPRLNPGSRSNLEFQKSCTPSYLNNDGHPENVPAQNAPFAGNPMEFYSILREWRANGDFAGLDLRREQESE